ncbi:MAG: hypothetical protein V3T54_01315 [Acidobacteriota bacterium]
MKDEFCDKCGATMVEYRFRLNKGLVSCLGKLLKAGGQAIRRDLHLKNSEYTNFPKLAYWGLAEQKPDETGRRRGHPWEITQKGRFFLARATMAFGTVVTYRGKVLRIEDKPVWIDDVDPDYKLADWYALTRQPAGPLIPPDKQGRLPLMEVA